MKVVNSSQKTTLNKTCRSTPQVQTPGSPMQAVPQLLASNKKASKLHSRSSDEVPAGGRHVQLDATAIKTANYGRTPLNGPSMVKGFDDDPLSDRAIVRALQGRSYLPLTVDDALALGTTRLVDTTGASTSGYRALKRATNTITSDASARYAHTRTVIAQTVDRILERCALLGYNITRDNLRIIDGLESLNTYLIKNLLLVLMMPLWKNSYSVRSVTPGWDGSACMFRLTGRYTVETSAIPYLSATNRTTRESKTLAWFNRPRGQ